MGDDTLIHEFGPLTVARNGASTPIRGSRTTIVLALLTVRRGQVTSSDELIERCWPLPHQPPTARQSLANVVGRLRATMGHEAIETTERGYRLAPEVRSCRTEFLSLARAADAHLRAGRFQEADREAASALGLWQGPPWEAIDGLDVLDADRAHLVLTKSRLIATRARVAANEGRLADSAQCWDSALAGDPYNERWWAALADVQLADGRRTDGLRTIEQARRSLAETGLLPGPELQAIERDLLGVVQPTAAGSIAQPRPPVDLDANRVDEATAGLPIDMTPFIGRRADIDAVTDRLSHTRLVTLTGTGGVGKTRLAAEVARRTVDRYAEGVRFCPLTEVTRAEDVPGAIMTMLGITPGRGERDIDRIIEWLGDRQLLLLVDNCEHVIDAIGTLAAEIMTACPNVTVLATSREGLGVWGEHTWPVQPLTVPTTAVDPGEARSFDVIELFEERARAVRPDFVIDEPNLVDVLDICARVDGLPLAVELAAARVTTLSPAEISSHLHDRFRLLGNPKTAPRRNLLGTVEWSYELLDGAQRLLFDQLSIFPGGFTLEAAIAVVATSDLGRTEERDRWEVLEVISQLVEKSMLAADQLGGESRYRMLETMRAYGLVRLAERGETDTVSARLAAWALASCRTLGGSIRGADSDRASRRLDAELPNLRRAHDLAIELGDLDTATGIVIALEDYSAVNLTYEVARWAERTLAADDRPAAPHRHRLLGVMAFADWAVADYEKAIDRASEALAAESWSDGSRSWLARQARVNSMWFGGDHPAEESLAAYLDWASEAAAESDDFQRAWALAQFGVAASSVAPTEEHRRLTTEALSIARRLQNPFLLALSLYANAEWVLEREPERALALLEMAVSTGSRSARFSYGICLTAYATLAGRSAAPAPALTSYLEACAVWSGSGNWANQWILFRNLVEFLPRLGEHGLAAVLYGAVESVSGMNDPSEAEGRRLAEALESTRTELGDAAVASALARGAAMQPAEVVALVRGELTRLVDQRPSVPTDHTPS